MQELNCNQVVTLLTFYVEGKLNKNLSAIIAHHLSYCADCRQKYVKLKKILENYSEMKSKIEVSDSCIDEEYYNNTQYSAFKEHLSAYIDNELTEEESVRIKKIAIANPLARRDLENVIAFKQLLHSSFLRTKQTIGTDYARRVIENISQKPVPVKAISLPVMMSISVGIIFLCIIFVMNIF